METERIHRLERNVRMLSVYATGLTLLVGVLGVSAFSTQQSRGILRARGLIIEDAQGRERILLGAPIPHAKNRVRTDVERAMKEWSTRYPDSVRVRYIDGYRNRMRHSMHGLLVLDENGFDRIALGDSVPDPNIGRRIGPGMGLALNNAKGYERGGYGMTTVNGHDRIVVGLDSKEGPEGLALVLDDAGRVQVMVRQGQKTMLLGTLTAAEQGQEGAPAGFGVVIRDGKEVTERIVAGQR
jgi:hypothetical protein